MFDEIILAGAFKGANGQNQTFLNIDHPYMANLMSYNDLFIQLRPVGNNHWLNNCFLLQQLGDSISGMVLTGWQRFSHHRALCELLPVGIPALIKESLYLDGWSVDQKALAISNKDLLVGIDVQWTLD